MKILVLGYVVRGPVGGMAWHHLQYALGLARLGHDVLFLEDSDDYPSCYNPDRGVTDTDPAYGLRFAGEAFARIGLPDRWAYYDAHQEAWRGPAAGRLPAACAEADLLLNVSGINPLRPWLADVPARVLIDTDPVFTQVRHLTDPAAAELARGHTAFFTFGESLGPGSTCPDDGLPWRPTRQPVVLDQWPAIPPAPGAPYTTVMQWDSYAAREYGGSRFGMKSESFGPYVDLPARSGRPLELALGSPGAPREMLREQGWRLRDPLAVTRDPWTYRRYIQASRGEFSVAKHGYVAAETGWFSERSAAYLASGRPVVVQDTGFSRHLPVGRGLLAFDAAAAAVDALEAVEADYPAHCRAARALAEEYFDSGRVLQRLLDGVYSKGS